MQNYTHIKIYQTAKNLLKDVTEITKTFNREYRYTIGQDLYKAVIEFIVMIYDAYIVPDKKMSYENILNLRRQLQYIEIYTRLCCDIKQISKNKYAQLSKYTQDLENQSRGWLISMQKKLDNPYEKDESLKKS